MEDFEKFDIILNLEIVEHVENIHLYIKSCNRLLKERINVYCTLNRTFTSYKAMLDRIHFRWLPIGTHDWNKFIKPEELEKILSNENFNTIELKVLKFNPIFNKWRKSDDLSVNYIICSLKN